MVVLFCALMDHWKEYGTWWQISERERPGSIPKENSKKLATIDIIGDGRPHPFEINMREAHYAHEHKWH